jgi:F0F1-type ATP synthase alpha subunit
VAKQKTKTKDSSILDSLRGAFDQTDQALQGVLEKAKTEPRVEESGTVISIGSGIARVSGLAGFSPTSWSSFQAG